MPAPISRDDLLAELQRLGDDEPPTQREMRSDGSYTIDPYKREFGSWGEALEAAGYDTAAAGRIGSLSGEDVLDRLRQVAADFGHQPSSHELNDVPYLNRRTVFNHFETWDAALSAAGLDGEPPTYCEDCEHEFDSRRAWANHRTKVHGPDSPDVGLLEAIRELAPDDRPPIQEEMAADGPYSPQVYRTVYGSWREAVQAAGFEDTHRADPVWLADASNTSREGDIAHNRVSREALLSELRRLADDLGRPPGADDLTEYGEYSERPYYREFESLIAAQEAAGVETTRLQEGDTDSLVDEMQRLADELGHPPRAADMDAEGKYGANTYERRFGSWIDAQEAAGVGATRARPGNGVSTGVYDGDWGRARNRALDRDEYACQDCGLTDAEHREQSGRGLDVHHITPYASFDDPADAHELDNLVSLCRACHAARHSAD